MLNKRKEEENNILQQHFLSSVWWAWVATHTAAGQCPQASSSLSPQWVWVQGALTLGCEEVGNLSRVYFLGMDQSWREGCAAGCDGDARSGPWACLSRNCECPKVLCRCRSCPRCSLQACVQRLGKYKSVLVKLASICKDLRLRIMQLLSCQ